MWFKLINSTEYGMKWIFCSNHVHGTFFCHTLKMKPHADIPVWNVNALIFRSILSIMQQKISNWIIHFSGYTNLKNSSENWGLGQRSRQNCRTSRPTSFLYLLWYYYHPGWSDAPSYVFNGNTKLLFSWRDLEYSSCLPIHNPI